MAAGDDGLTGPAARSVLGALAAALAARGACSALGKRCPASAGRGGLKGASVTAARALAAPTFTTVAPVAAVPKPVDIPAFFAGLYERSSAVPRALARLPLPMWLLSSYTAVPLASVAAAVLCPNKALAARGLAGVLGCLLGVAAGASLEGAKRGAARGALLRLLAGHLQAATPVEELRRLVAAQRKRFGVTPDRPAGPAFEESHMGEMYRELLSALVDGPENDPGDLPAVRRLKTSLDLDAIVVGDAHKRASQLLVSKGHSGLDEESLRRSTDKLLFLSDRAFADEECQEAAMWEMNRVCDVLQISKADATKRISDVSRSLYRQDLGAVVSQVDASTAEALAGASAAFGLSSQETAKMNAETYRQIASNLLEGGELPAQGAATLASARAVLQLSDGAADAAFAAVAAPLLQRDVEQVSQELLLPSGAPGAVASSSELLARRAGQLGLLPEAASVATDEAFGATLRSLYDQACKEVKKKGDNQSLSLMDKMLSFAKYSGMVLSQLRGALAAEGDAGGEDSPLSLEADSMAGRRLYSQYLKRSFEGGAGATADPAELARLLQLSEADDEATRVDVCKPLLKALYLDTLEKALGAATGSDEAAAWSLAAGKAAAEGLAAGKAAKLSMAKAAVTAEVEKFGLPLEVVLETGKAAYGERLNALAGTVPTAHEKDGLDAALAFFELFEDDVRVLHLKAFARTYEKSVCEALGRSGVMTPATKEALQQLRGRLSLGEEDARAIFNGVVQERLTGMMRDVREAWEEATYTKEALAQVWKERGKDVGNDPFADGSGKLGVQEGKQPLEGVRGYKLMVEFVKVVQFYLSNQVNVQTKDGEDEYPVTVGKLMDKKTTEEIYGIYAWNSVTCQDMETRSEWESAKPHVGGILGMSPKDQKKVLERMVSRWANQFIKQKMQENGGELSEEDVGTLTNWTPQFFGIDKEVMQNIVQTTNKTMLQSKVLRLLNQPSVTPAGVQALRSATEKWDLELKKDLELTRPQLRALFRVEAAAVIEDPDETFDEKRQDVDAARDSWGLGEQEAEDQLQALLREQCKASLVNAVGDSLQGNEAGAVKQMQRLDLLAAFAAETEKIDLSQDWEVSRDMKEKLLKTYASSPLGSQSKRTPDVKLLEQVLNVA